MPSVTINFDATQATRLQAAFATPENPTPGMPELKQWLVRQMKAKVLQRERGIAEAAVVVNPFEPT